MPDTFISWTVSSFIMSSVLIAAILLTKTLFKSKLGARGHFLIWFLLIIKLVIPIEISNPISIYNITRYISQQVIYRYKSVAVEKITSVESAKQETQPVEVTVILSPKSPISSSDIPVNTISGFKVARNEVVESFIFIFWLIGVSSLIIYSILANLVFWSQVKNSSSVHDIKLKRILDDCKVIIGINTNVCLVQTDKVQIPIIFGLVRPWLIMPKVILSKLKDESFKYVILHELAHLKRKDILLNWLVFLLQIVYWYNPLVWYAFFRMREDRETACDALVLSVLDKNEYKEYGNMLISMLEHTSRPYKLAGVAGIIEANEGVKDRIRAIGWFHTKKLKISFSFVVIFTLVFGLVVTGKTGIIYSNNKDLSTITTIENSKNITQVSEFDSIRHTTGYNLKDILSKKIKGFDGTKYELFYSNSKAELWIENNCISDETKNYVKQLMDNKIIEVENFLGTGFVKQYDELKKPTFWIRDLDTSEPKYGGNVYVYDEKSAVIWSKNANTLHYENSVFSFVTLIARAISVDTYSSWTREGFAFSMGYKIVGNKNSALNNLNSETKKIISDPNEKLLASFLNNGWWHPSNSTENHNLNCISGSFVNYLISNISSENFLPIYKAQDTSKMVKEVTGKSLIDWKKDWLVYLGY